jgi:alkylated DNA nucleotide flippase Atl1
MTRRQSLHLSKEWGVVGDVSPKGRTPRQVCIALGEFLWKHGVEPVGSRANLVLEADATECMRSGDTLCFGEVTLRLTFACEPCRHGAQLAGSPMRRFREVRRYLAVVVSSGEIPEGSMLSVQHGVYESVPEDFASRCGWAVGRIPPGRVVSSLELISAIGASRSYLRTLPRWMAAAAREGQPVHRVLNAQLAAPSWAPNAHEKLLQEGLDHQGLASSQYALTDALWFHHLDMTEVAPARELSRVP